MPMYFFDTDYGRVRFRDEVGTDLPDNQAARDEAGETLGVLARDFIPGDACKEISRCGSGTPTAPRFCTRP
jgi:hypothetical protein